MQGGEIKQMNACPLCKNTTANLRHLGIVDAMEISCPRCGNYRMSRTMVSSTPQLTEDERFKISCYTREGTLYGKSIPTICTSNTPQRAVANGYVIAWDTIVAAASPHSISERIDRTLCNFSRLVEAGGWLPLRGENDFVLAYAKGENSWDFAVNQLLEDKLLEQKGGNARLTVKGWTRVAEIERGAQALQYKQAFVAMWFSPTMDQAWSAGFVPAIENGTGIKAMRVDLKEHNEKICDVIVSEIRKSRFLVADFTGDRGGVYFEAGFAKGLGIPVIFSCQRGEWEKKLHFDTRQYNHIIWDGPADLKIRLTNRIIATASQA